MKYAWLSMNHMQTKRQADMPPRETGIILCSVDNPYVKSKALTLSLKGPVFSSHTQNTSEIWNLEMKSLIYKKTSLSKWFCTSPAA